MSTSQTAAFIIGALFATGFWLPMWLMERFLFKKYSTANTEERHGS